MIGRNASYRLLSQVVSALINVGGMVLLANGLTAQGYGRYAFFYALIPLVASVADAGIGIVVTREIARRRSAGPRLFGDAILVRAVLAAALLGLVALAAARTLEPGTALLLVLVTATALLDYGQDPAIWVLRAHERMGTEAILLLVSQGVWIAGVAAALARHAGLPWLIGAATVAFAVRAVAGAVIVATRLYGAEFRPEPGQLRSLLRAGLPFGTAMFVVVLYSRVGVLLLQWLATPADLAQFHVAYLLSQPLGFIASALTLAAFPALARHAVGEAEAVRRVLGRACRYQLLVTLPLTAGLAILAGPLVERLFHGAGYGGAATALRLVAPGLTFVFLNLTSRYALAALDRTPRYLGAVVVGLAVNAALGVMLIPRWGFRGACLAYVAAEIATSIVCFGALARYLRAAEVLMTARKPLVATLVMSAVLLAFHHLHPFVLGAVGAAVYAACIALLGVLDPDEVAALQRLARSLGWQPPAGAGASSAAREGEAHVV